MSAYQDSEGKFIKYKMAKGNNKLLEMLREKHRPDMMSMPPPGTDISNFKF